MNIATLHRSVSRLHSSVPKRFFPGGRALPALHYLFHVTRRCNLRCSMCQDSLWLNQTPAADQAAGELSADQWRTLIAATGNLSIITFTGGEPWLRDDFPELLAFACSIRRTHFITNGTRFSGAHARGCVESAPKNVGGRGLNFVGVSLHGPPEAHDRIVGRAGVFEEAAGGIRALARSRDEMRKRCPCIHVTTVVQDKNVDVLSEMPQVLAEMGVDVLNLAREVPPIELERLANLEPAELAQCGFEPPRIAPNRLQAALDATRNAAERAGIELRLPDLPVGDLIRYYDGGIDLARFECGAAWTTLTVGATGEAYPCRVFSVGHALDTPLHEIWNGRAMRDCRRRLRERLYPPCQGCCFLRPTSRRSVQRRELC